MSPSERVAKLLAALPGDAPYGIDARYDPEHEAVRAEIAKLDAPGGAPVNWTNVASAGSALLCTRSKDFLIAAYTAHALHETEALGGLVDGLTLLHALLKGAWEGMFPPVGRAKARAGALGWFVERSCISLEAGGLLPEQAGHVPMLAALCTQISELSTQRFADLAPSFTPLMAALAKLGEASQLGTSAHLTPSAATSAASRDTGPAPTDATSAPTETRAADSGRQRLLESMSSWLAPISKDAPAGKDARFDPLHEELRALIKQVDSPIGHPIEWKKVVSKGELLLKERSKDLLIAAYAAYGLYRQEGLLGLGRGLCLLAGLLETYWDSAFPDTKRSQKARGAALAWVLGRLAALGDHETTPADADDIEALSEVAAWLATLISSRFEDDHRPAITPVLEQIERLKLGLTKGGAQTQDMPARAAQSAPKPKSADGSPTASVTQTTLSVPDAGPAPAIENRAELLRYLAGVHNTLVDMGKALRKANPRDPLAYMLPRLGASLELDEEPPTQNGKRTYISAPDRGEVQEIRGLLRDQSWEALLQAAELCAGNSPVFLDMHRLVHTALEQLGESYAASKRVVEGELCALVKRHPALIELSFSDGTPFADADTQTLLRTLTAAGGGPSAAGGGETDQATTDALAAARALAVGGNKLQALAAFEGVLQQAHSGRTRFRVRLALADAMLAAGDSQLAAGLFGTLYDEIERRGLDEWEPELAADCLASYHDCLTRGAGSSEMAQRSTLVYARLCRVDPRRALKTNS